MPRPETVGAGQEGILTVDARCARSSARCASGASCHGPSVPIVVEDLGHPLPCLRPSLGVPIGTLIMIVLVITTLTGAPAPTRSITRSLASAFAGRLSVGHLSVSILRVLGRGTDVRIFECIRFASRD